MTIYKLNIPSASAHGGALLDDQFGPQLDRLSTLIDKLEGKVLINTVCTHVCIFLLLSPPVTFQIKLDTVEEEEVADGTKGTVSHCSVSLILFCTP